MNRKRFLSHPMKPFEISADRSTDQIVAEMASTAYQGRRLGEAFEIWSRMLKKRQIVIWMGLGSLFDQKRFLSIDPIYPGLLCALLFYIFDGYLFSRGTEK